MVNWARQRLVSTSAIHKPNKCVLVTFYVAKFVFQSKDRIFPYAEEASKDCYWDHRKGIWAGSLEVIRVMPGSATRQRGTREIGVRGCPLSAHSMIQLPA